MKICRAYWSVVLALALLSCTKEEVRVVRHEIIASAGDDAAVKSELNPSVEGQMRWNAGEQVNVFVGDVSYIFTGSNTDFATSVTFTGKAPAALGTYVMLSPYNSLATMSGGTISTTLPAAQSSRAGSFTDGTVVLAGQTSEPSVTCKHVCSGLRFKVTNSDITRVSLSGLNGEKIAGDFSFSFSEGNPVASAGTLEEVVLTPSDGTHFTPNEWYYLAVLPTVFSNGICLTALSDSKGTGTLTLAGPITFSRAKFRNKANLDGAMTWSTDSPTPSNTCYGPANSFCLRPNGSVTIDVAPRRILPGWLRSSIDFSGAPVANGYEILWNTGSVTASLSGTTLTLNAGASPGTALVAIKKNDTILWSFLVWVTESAPAELELPTGKKILPPLGGDLYFQWGRKDPLKSNVTRVVNQNTGGLTYSIQHPDQYIKSDIEGSAYDWFCKNEGDQDASLWGDGGVKTVWDPCPEGYRVPSEADFTHTSLDKSYLESHFSVLGYVHNDGPSSTSRTYWTRTVSGTYSTSLDDNHGSSTDPFYGQTRNIAAPVRCVKE